MNIGKHIVLATHGTLGDLYPYLAIACELRRRGHRPVVATSEYYRELVTAAGIDFHALRPDVPADDKELYRRFIEPKRGMERVIREFVMPNLRDTYDDLLAAVQNGRGADLLISQILIFAAPLVAERSGVPWVSSELQPAAFVSAYDPPVLAPLPALAKLRGLGPLFHKALFGLMRLTARSWGAPVRALRHELGLSPGSDPLFDDRHSPGLVLALFSSVLGPAQVDWPANTVITGFPFYDESETPLAPTLARFLDEGEPPIVFTLGSSAVHDAGSFYTESIAAAQSIGKRAVLLVGDDPLNCPTSSLTRNVIAVPYAPFARLFPRASLIVHQGGVGTTGQALRAGKASLVMPYGGDHYDNAGRLERLGAGRTIMRKRYTAELASAELRELIQNPRYNASAVELGCRVSGENGVLVACDAIDEELERSAAP